MLQNDCNLNMFQCLWECGMGPMPAHLKKQLEAQGTNLKKKGDKDDDTLFLTVLII